MGNVINKVAGDGNEGGGKPRPYGTSGRGRACPYSLFLLWPVFFCLLLAGCSPRTTPVQAQAAPFPAPPDGDILAPGVVHRAIPGADGGGMDIIDIDLDNADAHLTIQTRGIVLANGRVVGQAQTPREWLTRLNGLAAVNGGYFGQEDTQGRKEFVGLLVQKGRVRHAAPPLFGQGSATVRRGRYVRAVFCLSAAGKPDIAWLATDPGHPQTLHIYSDAMGLRGPAYTTTSAVGCGPMLIQYGRDTRSQYEERLVSPGLLPRTFVAFDRIKGVPRHLILGIASGEGFEDLTVLVSQYFSKYDQTEVDSAMCLDGGASTQMTYRLHGTLQSPRETGVSVPDALVLLPGRP